MKPSHRHFTRGFVCAIAEVLRQHGATTIAADLLRVAGTLHDIEEAANIEDIEVLRAHGFLVAGQKIP